MPIDPSIPLQVQPLKLETPMNTLAMASEVMKMGEYQQAAQEKNALRSRMAQGNFDINNPAHRQEISAIAPTIGPKFMSEMAGTNKNIAQTQEATQKIDSSKRIEAVQRIVGAPDAATAANILQSGMADGSVPVQHGTDMLKQLSTMSYPDWQMNTIRSVVKPETRYTHETVSAGTKAQLNQSAAQHADVQNRPQYIQTDTGLVAVPNVLKPGQTPTGIPVMGANGENLGKPLKPIPANINTAISENDIALNKVNRALDLNAGKEITLPSGAKIQGSATATGFFKGLTPQVILNSWDPSGVDTRSFIADIGSLKVHDRSGAAVTASETPRLKPFIPSINDSAETAAKKLTNFKAEYQDIQNNFAETYSREQGYRPSPVLSGKSSGGGNKPSLDSIFNPKQ